MKLKLVEKEGAKELRETTFNIHAKQLGLYDGRFPTDAQSGGYDMLRYLVFNPEVEINEYRLMSFHANLRKYVIRTIDYLRENFYGNNNNTMRKYLFKKESVTIKITATNLPEAYGYLRDAHGSSDDWDWMGTEGI